MKYIDSLSGVELKGKRVFLRTSLNLPLLDDGSVGDLFRLKRGIPTIRFLVERGARVIIAGYLGRSGDSMRPVAEELIKALPEIPVRFFGTDMTHVPREVAALRDGECLVLENMRRCEGEEKKDETFSTFLASLADVYVSDAFAEAHRDYASNVGIASRLPSYAGLLMRDEIEHLNVARMPHAPSFAILGGAKFETKAPLVAKLLASYDHLFIAGALANDVFRAQGYSAGVSLVSKKIPGNDVLTHPHFISPLDATVETHAGHVCVKKPENVVIDDRIVDTGPYSIAHIAPYIADAQYILWNGPTGIYERGYTTYTKHIAYMIAQRVSEGAQCVIGGGDTIAAIDASGVDASTLGFLSTGGGAMLEYLLKGTLPAIEALK